MFIKLKSMKKSCYLLHQYDNYVVKVNSMIVNVKKIALYILFYFS